IYQNDKKSAAEYLSKFSDLMRSILQMSSKPDVRLSDELETLRLYIELEAMLLEPPFEYDISADDSTNTHIIKIPALLLQPFVENAFKHGLRYKKGNKKLTLHAKKIDGVLEVIITDNGIGRKASTVVQQLAPQTHYSFASEATAKRIDLVNSERNQKIGLNYVDLDEGTQVVITIPIINATE
ncbi:MAG: histidine kinase, partial [Chitinophagales bacterium]|nr:histidine kinase [Chitinophagales bacterium]